MPVPTPISVRRSRGMPSIRPYSQAALRQTASVPSITGSDATPTRAASAIESWVPSSTTEHCSTNVLAYLTPGASRSPGLMRERDDRADHGTGDGAADQRHVLPDDGGHGGDGDREREAGEDGPRLSGIDRAGAGEVTAADEAPGAGEARVRGKPRVLGKRLGWRRQPGRRGRGRDGGRASSGGGRASSGGGWGGGSARVCNSVHGPSRVALALTWEKAADLVGVQVTLVTAN